MKVGRRVLFSLFVLLLTLSAPSALPAQAHGVASQPVAAGGNVVPLGRCHLGSQCSD